MTRYEQRHKHELSWHQEDPLDEIKALLEKLPDTTLAIKNENGNIVEWRRVSRNKEIVQCIMNAIFKTRNFDTNLQEEAEIIYDRLEQEGHLK